MALLAELVQIFVQMKKEMIDHTIWSNMRSTRHVRMTVQVLMDDVKRIAVRDQDYYYHAIPNTRFSLGIALPSNGGKHRVKGGIQPNNNVDGWFSECPTKIYY